jgi:hypothetical protein
MNALDRMARQMASLPTVMDIADEMAVFAGLMRVPAAEVAARKELFCDIVERLELSHIDGGWCQLDASNEGFFQGVRAWLAELKRELRLPLDEALIDNLGLRREDIERRMRGA